LKKIFLDCGSHHLEGLKAFFERKIIDETFEIHTFEANPECRIKDRLKNFKLKNCKVHEAAVWISDGTLLFNQENHEESKSRYPYDGISKIDGWGSSVYGIGYEHKGYSTPIEVKSIDFGNFVNKLEESYIICKMDIEGSEFEVLKKMIEDNSISRISKLYVEFHDRFMPKEKNKNKIIEKIQSKGVDIIIST
jgi:FkbM family methyltransferase